ncbi:MAG: hypothetical protein HYY96_16060 [Candidatus Tectomicrobia bacterium]|nr:hypothetical protein [Candidatus Tectomicrobia bacterium]
MQGYKVREVSADEVISKDLFEVWPRMGAYVHITHARDVTFYVQENEDEDDLRAHRLAMQEEGGRPWGDVKRELEL